MAKKSTTTKKDKSEGLILALAEGTLTKEQIPALVSTIDAKLAQLKGPAEDSEGIKNISLPHYGTLANITDVKQLILALATVNQNYACYNAAKEELQKDLGVNIKMPCYKIEGFKIESIKKAIASQILKISRKDQIAKLEKAKKEASQYLSEQDRINQSLQNIGNLLSTEDDE